MTLNKKEHNILKAVCGFTLLEVMIALAFLAIGLVGVFLTQSQSISMATESRFMTTAALLAQSKMADAEMATALSNHSEDGDFGDDYPQYKWKLEISDTEFTQFKKIEVTVSNKIMISRGTYKLVLYKMVTG
jgi:general secretion pathway protein I